MLHDVATTQLEQRRNRVGHLADKAQHERVATETEFAEVGEAEEALGEGLELVVVEPQRLEVGETRELLGDGLDLVVAEHESCQPLQEGKLMWNVLQPVAA